MSASRPTSRPRWGSLAGTLLVASGLGACAGAYVPPRFVDAPVRSMADDRVAVAELLRAVFPPAARYSDAYVRRVVADALEPRRIPTARDVSALDDVVESSWFRASAPPDLTGYESEGPPARPLATADRRDDSPTVDDEGKHALDARSRAWELVVASRDRAAAAAIASRLAHAIGYRTAEVHRVEFEGQPAIAWRLARGSSRRVVDLGPTRPHGVRDDDANDTLAHEDHRSLRALGVLFAWMGLDRVRDGALRDVYVGPTNAGYAEHVLVDLGEALGVGRARPNSDATRPAAPRRPLTALVTLGIAKDPAPTEALLPLGGLSPRARLDDDGLSVPFGPVERALPGDRRWAAMRLARLEASTIEAAVAAGSLDPDEHRALVRALVERRDALVREVAAEVTLLRPRAVESIGGAGRVRLLLGEEVCAIAPSTCEAPVEVIAVDDANEPIPAAARRLASMGEVAIDIELGRASYAVVVVRRAVEDRTLPVEVHLRRDARGVRVVGVRHGASFPFVR